MFKNLKDKKNTLIEENKHLVIKGQELQKEIDDLNKNKSDLIDEVVKLKIDKDFIINDIKALSIRKDELNKELKNRENFWVETELKYINTLEGHDFEYRCAELLAILNYTDISVTPRFWRYGL